MKFLKFKRVALEGWRSFRRNTWLTVATVGILSLSLFVIGNTLFIGMSAHEMMESIEKNVNISVYFKNNVEESRINEIKSELEKRPEIAKVEYISKDAALDKFTKDHDGDEVIKEALEEIGENPLFSSLVLTANNQSGYDSLVKYVENNFKEDIDRINYGRNKATIEKLNKSTTMIRRNGLINGLIFILISVLVTFSAVRMSIYNRKKEFDIMRLVGASNLYIRMPLLIEGAFYGLSASLIAFVCIAAVSYSQISLDQSVIPRAESMRFYFEVIWKIGLIIVFSGVGIGVLSSCISIRKYLKI